MEDTQICRICNEEKPLSEFSMRTYDSGNVAIRKECKKCRSKASVKKEQEKRINPIPKKEPYPKQEKLQPAPIVDDTPSEYRIDNNLTSMELLQLRDLLKHHKDIMRMFNPIKTVDIDKKNRDRITLTINHDIMDIVKEYARTHDKTWSDIVNLALIKYFE